MKINKLMILPIVAVVLAACAREDRMDDAMRQQIDSDVSVVEVLDVETRQAILRDSDGNRRAVTVGPEVPDLQNVMVGDLVTTTTVKRTVARLAKPADVTEGELDMTAAVKRDNLPARDSAELTRQVVEIIEVSKLGDTVTYLSSDGEKHTIEVEDDKMRAFARGLNRYEYVVIETATTVTISVVAAN